MNTYIPIKGQPLVKWLALDMPDLRLKWWLELAASIVILVAFGAAFIMACMIGGVL